MASIGETLREARKKKGISDEVASKALRIKLDRLRDLEEDRYDQFPAHVYVRSFLRHYADYLGIDSAPLIQQFSEQVPQPEPKAIFDITEDQRARSPVQRHVSVPTTAAPSLSSTGRTVLIAALAVIGVAAVCGYWIMKMPPTPAPLPPPSPEVSSALAAPETPPSDSAEPLSQPSMALPSLTLSTNAVPELHRTP